MIIRNRYMRRSLRESKDIVLYPNYSMIKSLTDSSEHTKVGKFMYGYSVVTLLDNSKYFVPFMVKGNNKYYKPDNRTSDGEVIWDFIESESKISPSIFTTNKLSILNQRSLSKIFNLGDMRPKKSLSDFQVPIITSDGTVEIPSLGCKWSNIEVGLGNYSKKVGSVLLVAIFRNPNNTILACYGKKFTINSIEDMQDAIDDSNKIISKIPKRCDGEEFTKICKNFKLNASGIDNIVKL